MNLVAWLREKLGMKPEVVKRTYLRNGQVVTVMWPDRTSPTGLTYQVTAFWKDGTVAERRWMKHVADAEAGHDGAVIRHERRTIPV